jgi:hypothetical protein
MTSPIATHDTPAVTNAAYDAQRPDWIVVDDVYSGTKAIQKKKDTYTPRAQGESDPRYERRLNRSRFYNVYRRTITGLVGRVFRRPPKLASDTTSPQIEAHVENIDGQGTHLAVFARRVFTHAVHHGHAAILIDAPRDPNLGRKPRLKEISDLGLRPYWVPVKADQIVNFATDVIRGVTVLTQVSIRECRMVADGRFGESEDVTYRVFTLTNDGVTWELWSESAGKLSMEDSGIVKGTKTIPVIPIYAVDPLGWFHSRPTLLDLAETNLDHYAIQSDHRYSLHVASIPIPVIKNDGPINEPIPISVEDGIRLGVNGDAYFLEHKGTALGQTRQEMQDLEERMALLGMATLSRRTNQAETAEAKRIDAMEQESTLAVAARSLQDALEQGLHIHAEMIGEEAPSITVNFDFDGLTMTPEQFRAHLEAWQSGAYTLETFWTMMEQGGLLPEDFDRETETQALAEQAMATPVVPDKDEELVKDDEDETERLAA